MICERCSTPMMPIYSPRDGWRYACVKCGAVRDGRPASCNEQAGVFAERGLNCFALQDFDEARDNFAQAARLDGDRPAYLWAMLLAQCGIRYCETGEAQYTVTFWKKDLPAQLFTAQPEYHKLRRGAAGELEALRYYKQEAAELDRGLQQVREAKREPYDVFLCFKDLDEHGLTPERQLCDGLYHELLERGLNVFYAPRTLYGKYVVDYEASIHNALRDAKLLVVAASSGKNAASPWVESEWKRFQLWHQGGGQRLMTCVVGSMTPGEFPKELQRYQCELYAKEGQLNDRQTLEAIAARIERDLPKEAPRKPNRRAIAAAVIAVVLAVGGVLVWRLLPPRDGNNPTPEEGPVEAVITEVPATEVPVTEVPATEVPVTEAPATEAPTAKPSNWPLMRAYTDVHSSGSPRVLGSEYSRYDIQSIHFENNLDGAPEDAWDVSENGDGSVMAWVTRKGKRYDLTIAGEGGVRAPRDCSNLFYDYKNVESIRFNGCFDTSGVTDMHSMFYSCSSLPQLDLTDFDTSQVTDMHNMFGLCRALVWLNLSSFDTSRTTDMRLMFWDCESLAEVRTGSGFVVGEETDVDGDLTKGCPLDHIGTAASET